MMRRRGPSEESDRWSGGDLGGNPRARELDIPAAGTTFEESSGGRSTMNNTSGRARGDVAVVYSDDYLVRLGGLERLHPFDIHKYEKIVRRLEEAGALSTDDLFEPTAVSRTDQELVHSAEYLETFNDSRHVATYLEARVLRGLPDSVIRSSVVRPFECATGGTILATRLALEHGIGINVGGGYHHAKPDLGEGFNLINDIAIAIRKLMREGSIDSALVVDLDVHQGNGTAVCFEDEAEVFTFSMHQRDIYPIPKETSDLDVELSHGTTDAEYLDRLDEHWPDLIERVQPDVILYQAGCDPLHGDPLASLALSAQGIVDRDCAIVDAAVACGVPVVMLLGGGYSDEAWEVQHRSILQILDAHG